MRKKREAEEPKTPPFEIGRSGTVEQFSAANDAAIAHQSKGKHLKSSGDWFFSPTYPEYLGTEDQTKLREGAVQALHEERPENIQALMIDPVRFALRSGTVRDGVPYSKPHVRLIILCQLINGRSDPSADIRLALAAFDPEKKQQILDDVLCEAVKTSKFPETAFIAALLEAGADANTSNGWAFASAIYQDMPEDAIQLLYKKGASFREALFIMEKDTDKWGQKTITRLDMYRKKFTGESDDELSAVKKELAELNERFNILSQQLTAQAPPAAPAPPRVSPAPEPEKRIRISKQP